MRRGGRGSPGHAGPEVVAVPAGGWYCFNRENCDSRYDTMRRLMSSRDWPLTRTGRQGAPLRGRGASWSSQFEVLEEPRLGSLEPQSGPALSASLHLLTLTHTRMLTHAHTLTRSHTHALTHSHSRTHTHSHAHTLAHTLTHSHSHSLPARRTHCLCPLCNRHGDPVFPARGKPPLVEREHGVRGRGPPRGAGSGGLGRWTSRRLTLPCVAASSPTAPATSGVGLHPSLTRVSPLCSPLLPFTPQDRAGWRGFWEMRASALEPLLSPNTRRVPRCLLQRPPPACPWRLWRASLLAGPWGVAGQSGLRTCPPHPSPPGPGPGPPQALWTTARTPLPFVLAVGGLALCPGPHPKSPPFSEQMNMPSWAPSSSRRWCGSFWAKG